MRPRPSPLFAVLALLAACAALPPQPWLRYVARDPAGWTAGEHGRLMTTLLGAAIAVDLHERETRVDLIVENSTGGDLVVRLGAETTQAPTAAIGEVQRRRLDQARAEDVPEIVPYVSMQPAEVRTGFRATFALDNPLGREPTIGQYFVLVVEARDSKGGLERRLLPLTATNAGPSRR